MNQRKSDKKAVNEITKGKQEVKLKSLKPKTVIEEYEEEIQLPSSLNENLAEILAKDPKRFFGCGG